MSIDNPEEKAFLYELYTMTQDDMDVQVSMYDVGSALGLEKDDASAMAENLFIQGVAELKTLSGGIGITRQGLEALDVKVAPKSNGEVLTLGTSTIIEDQGQKALEKILQEIKKCLAQTQQPYEQLEEIVIDIKTIETQMLSPTPKTAIIREILRSLHNSLKISGPKDLTAKLNGLVTS
ncbi:MAG: hypothetical protein GY699_11385 [Desulfobacteraceae bacterium]|nr:hypothetical protein [Desulfobacteraceae bacterium]